MTRRSRAVYLCLTAFTVASGLASRRFPAALPPFIATYAGDTLWAAMVFLLGAVAWPAARTGPLAAGALAFAVVIEISQLYRAPWIEALRSTRLGALVLGQGFLWSDLACYAFGVSLVAMLDWIAGRASVRRTAPPRG